jgi:hypothetical protein
VFEDGYFFMDKSTILIEIKSIIMSIIIPSLYFFPLRLFVLLSL